jgi:hypothetical protein
MYLLMQIENNNLVILLLDKNPLTVLQELYLLEVYKFMIQQDLKLQELIDG